MERKLKKVVLLLLIPLLIFSLAACKMGSHNKEAVRAKMEKALYEEYGKEFIVDRIGTRKYPDGKIRYVARIYPKSIIGTSREGDPYYCAQAGVEKKSLGRLGEVGAGYETVQIKLEAEDYLRSKTKEIFGDRIRMKLDVKYKLRKEGNDYFSWQIVSGFKELLKKSNTNPDKHRLELELYVYIFDRIDSDEEKEERREQIFDFVQYLKEEGLFKYLSLIIEIVDEKALTPSYRKYKRELELSEKETVKINGIKVELPLKELIKEVSEVLGKELKEQNEQELIKNMSNIRQDELGINGIEGYLEQYFIRIISIDMMKVQPYGEYREEKEKGRIKEYRYLKKEDIKFGKENPKYIFR